MANAIILLVREEDGQGLTEYALLLCLIALSIITSFVGFRLKLTDLFGHITTVIP